MLLKMDAADGDSPSQNVFAELLIAAHRGMVLVVFTNAILSALEGFREVRPIGLITKPLGFVQDA